MEAGAHPAEPIVCLDDLQSEEAMLHPLEQAVETVVEVRRRRWRQPGCKVVGRPAAAIPGPLPAARICLRYNILHGWWASIADPHFVGIVTTVCLPLDACRAFHPLPCPRRHLRTPSQPASWRALATSASTCERC